MDTDRNLLFGVLALQADLVTADQFAKACALWAAEKSRPLADVLVGQGWLAPSDRVDVDRLLQRKLAKHQGDVRASLAEVTTDRVRQSLDGVADRDVRQSLAGLTPPPAGHVLLAQGGYGDPTGARQRHHHELHHGIGRLGPSAGPSRLRNRPRVGHEAHRPDRQLRTGVAGRAGVDAQGARVARGRLRHQAPRLNECSCRPHATVTTPGQRHPL